MLSNEQMREGRFARWSESRRKLSWIKSRLDEGLTVYVQTHLRCTAFKAKHAGMFKATSSGLYVQAGKRWDCIDYCRISAS